MGRSSDFSVPSAPLGRRFLTYLVDSIVLSVIMSIFMFLFFSSVFTELVVMDPNDPSAIMNVYASLFSAYALMGALSLLYWIILEGVKGQTIGKMAAGTIVVSTKGEEISIGKAFVRTICRLIPFEVFSGLFRESREFWHDSIPDTRVVMKEDWQAYLDGEDEFE